MVGMLPRASIVKFNLAMSGGFQLRYSFPFIGKTNLTMFLAYVTRIDMTNQNKISLPWNTDFSAVKYFLLNGSSSRYSASDTLSCVVSLLHFL